MRRWWSLCIGFSSLGVLLGAAPSAPGPAVPTPADWEQWQPETDQSDRRLGNRVSVWEEEIRLGELLTRLSQATSVGLEAAEELRPVRLTVFARERTLGGIMVALARVFGGRWYHPRGEPPEGRGYCLAGSDPLVPLSEEWYEEEKRRDEEADRAVAAAHRAEREERLALYREALALTPAEVLERYEATDPALCADLLCPAFRPMIEGTLALGEPGREELLSTGELCRPVAGLSPAFRQHLADWAGGKWELELGTGIPAVQPDRLARFSTPEERWQHSRVKLLWWACGLHLVLYVPDAGNFQVTFLRFSRTNTPLGAREHLIYHGYREDTPQHRQMIRREAEAWQQVHPRGSPSRSEDERDREIRAAIRYPAPNETDPRLDGKVEVGEAVSESAAKLLEQAARQRLLAVVATYLPPDEVRVAVPEPGEAGVTLAGLLNAIRASVDQRWWWNFYGEYLVARDPRCLVKEAEVLPEEMLSMLREKLRPGGSVQLGELADILAGLNIRQLDRLSRRSELAVFTDEVHEDSFPQLVWLPLHEIRQYGLLDSRQREKLVAPQGVRLSELRADQQWVLQGRAQRERPWVELKDLRNAAFRAIPHRLSTGEEAISFVIEYHLPDYPNDRDVLFTSPLEIHLPDA
jgi:hypothetical protein